MTLAERLEPEPPLAPTEPEQRVRMFGLAHELAGEGGLGWCARLLVIDGSLRSDGARGFPLRAAKYLARKYGYAPERVEAAEAKIREVLALMTSQLERSKAAGQAYLMGDALSALDIYLAAFLSLLVGVSEADCPTMSAEFRPIYSYLPEELGIQVPRALVEHRAFMYSRQRLPWPLQV